MTGMLCFSVYFFNMHLITSEIEYLSLSRLFLSSALFSN